MYPSISLEQLVELGAQPTDRRTGLPVLHTDETLTCIPLVEQAKEEQSQVKACLQTF